MFRKILLHPDEKDYHRYLVRNSQGNIQDWRMLRLTFGVASSPFLATTVLRQLAEDYKEDYPTASSIILSSFYVDDCLTGANTVQEAEDIRSQLCSLLQKAGMTGGRIPSSCLTPFRKLFKRSQNWSFHQSLLLTLRLLVYIGTLMQMCST